MTIKSLLKSVLRKFGYDVVRHVPGLERPFTVLPLLVRHRLAENEDFFFVQVGANDGLMDDPLRELILEHQLPGLMIEPQPHVFEQLCCNYKGQPGLLFEQVAVSTEEGMLTMYSVMKEAPISSDHSGLASFDKNHLLKEGVPAQYIEQRSVPGVKLGSLLAKYGIIEVDLLQVDVEGYDYNVVRSALESDVHAAMINYEHCHLTPRVRLACKQLLDRHGYRFIEVGKDTLAVRHACPV